MNYLNKKELLFLFVIVFIGFLFYSFSSFEQNFFKNSCFNSPCVEQNNIVQARAFFCPEDFCSIQLINEIDLANETIFVAIYSFTHKDIADALIRAKNKGISVKVVVDFLQSTSQHSLHEYLLENGISIVVRKGLGSMHNKFVIIDSKKVFTGSFNFSLNADTKNDENLVLINDELLAKNFLLKFDELFYSN